ncbi:kinesin-like protein KIF19 isoform X1 [Moschus berezovskii]|uniref:kinesin-like protein KIF19 isoform X1 n=1 Tax=Moschus berezovskii TaxID=68408 RepID=UPI0024443AD6|nr:kinesin-like protein KIF19 isoform X1 [Moschus berezovskii]
MPSRPAAGPSPARGSPAMREMEPKDQQLTVALRIRPLNDTELEEGAAVIAHKVGDQMVVLMDPSEDPEDPLRTHRSREKTFIFDVVFDQHASQEDVYLATTQQLVEGVISGYNATVFAYGPSGAGKTHTMLGTDTEPGIYLQTLSDLFQALEETGDSTDCSVSMSYLEIYNEVIRDLLNPSSGFLDLREDSRGSIQIAGITEVSTSNAQEIMQLLSRGNRQRTQEPTAANKASSRSHAVLRVAVRRRGRGARPAEEARVGRLFMVDLAGSERAAQTQNQGKRMKEGAHINRSLLALGNCINALSEKGGSRAQYVNFRDSKLTRLLKDALGGNSRTVMIAHISPASTHFEESRTTLLYAYRAKNIKTRVKRNLLSVSYHIAQYTDVISELRGQIQRLKAKVERQERERRGEPGGREARATIPAPDAEEDSRLQMNRIRAQLVGAFTEQLEMRRSLVELENTSIELHVDTSRHLLTIADWEREQTHRLAHRAGTPERDEEALEASPEGDEGEPAEPHEVALAREEVSMLLAEQRKIAALKAGLEQRLANAKKKASQMEELLPTQVISEDQREVLRLLCRAHELEVENTGLQADSLRRRNLLCQKDFVIQRCQQHRWLCERIIQEQQQLIQDSGLAVPEALEQRFRLYSRELGAGTLNRLLLLHAVMASSLRDGSVLNISPPPEEPSQDQLDDREDLPWGAQFELPPMLLDPDSDGCKSSKATPSKTLGKQDSLLPPPLLHILLSPPAHEKPSSQSMKTLVSKLCSPAGREPGTPTPRTAAEAGLSAQALKEMAIGTKSIALIAATRRSRAQDHEGSSGRSSLHPPEEAASDPKDPKSSVTPETSLADRKWPQASPGRARSAEKARGRRSPPLTRSVQLATGKLPPPSTDHRAGSQPPPAPPQLSKSPGKSFLPAVPSASKMRTHCTCRRSAAPFPAPPGRAAQAQAGRPCCPGTSEGLRTVEADITAHCLPATPAGARAAAPRGQGDQSKDDGRQSSIRVFSSESALHIRWPKYWSFSFTISPSSEHPGLISFRMDWLDLLAVQGTLKNLLQHHSSKASILRRSAFFICFTAYQFKNT